MEAVARRHNSGESIYLVALVCYLMISFLKHSMFLNISFLKVVLFSVVILCCLVKFFFIDRHTKKELLLISLAMFLVFIVTLKSDNRQLLMLSALIVSAKNVNFKNALFAYLVTMFLLLSFTFLCSMADIIPNLQFTRMRDGELIIRNSFGMNWPTMFAQYVFYSLIAYSYFINEKKLFSHISLIIFSILGYIICQYTDSRMSAYGIILNIFV